MLGTMVPATRHYHPALSRQSETTLSSDRRVREPRARAVRRDESDRSKAALRKESQSMKPRQARSKLNAQARHHYFCGGDFGIGCRSCLDGDFNPPARNVGWTAQAPLQLALTRGLAGCAAESQVPNLAH